MLMFGPFWTSLIELLSEALKSYGKKSAYSHPTHCAPSENVITLKTVISQEAFINQRIHEDMGVSARF